MESKSSLFVWNCAFAMSAIVAVALFCEVKGMSVLPDACGNMVDRGPVGKLILIVFAVSLAINARNSLSVFAEFSNVRRGLQSDPSSSRLQLVGHGLLGEHVRRMYQIYGHAFDGDVSQDVSLGAIRSRLFGREWLVRTSGQLLLTLGLIGTVVGLATSLGGLSSTVRSMTANNETVSDEASDDTATTNEHAGFTGGLDTALGGMESAFATTLLGAILGGVFLKLLSNCTQYLADHLVDEIEIIAETELVPMLRASNGDVSARRREMLTFMDEAIEKETARLKSVSERIEAITEKFDRLANAISGVET